MKIALFASRKKKLDRKRKTLFNLLPSQENKGRISWLD
jgi:hypothetical protein